MVSKTQWKNTGGECNNDLVNGQLIADKIGTRYVIVITY